MRADTHDGPKQMLHVRGLIHCCSSHVRRSWNSVLQRTAGPYIPGTSRTTRNGPAGPLSGIERASLRHCASSSEDRTGLFGNLPDDIAGGLRLRYEANTLSGPQRHGINVTFSISTRCIGLVANDMAA